MDRDGVVNRYPGDKKYVTSLKKFKFIPGAKKAISKLANSGYKIFIISNQAGVGKGTYSKRTLNKITQKMLREIEKAGGKIEQVYYCTHPKELNCSCRKPKAGMIKKAKNKYGINLKNSFFIGDTMRDIKTARVAGCRSVLVFSGKEKEENSSNWEIRPDFVFRDLFRATTFILRKNKK